ncbi:hypothetical protein C0Q70_04812 [Pomacea canaliculata]|uniref:TIR domain-containing protein n=1 Tax=Pomacea canaliculata TaxID=400727 RepID=A0A2T7PJE5_POMCA|nr:hypothetical protein C0Q70_04812 [Pomacea canaliculata]
MASWSSWNTLCLTVDFIKEDLSDVVSLFLLTAFSLSESQTDGAFCHTYTTAKQTVNVQFDGDSLMSSQREKTMPRACRFAKHLILVFCLTNLLVVSPCVADDVSKRGEDCYQRMCWCSHDIADCSDNYGRLQFVPKLPSTISKLDFSFNNLTQLHSDFFSNVTQLPSINLTGNGLSSIDQHAFRGLHNLTHITLDKNNLDFNSVRPVLNVSSLIHLRLCKNYKVTYIPDNIFLEFSLPRLRELIISGSSLRVLNMSVFKPLKKLVTLDVGNSDIQRIVGDILPLLNYLFLNNNNIQDDFMQTCSNTNESLYPMLRYLSLKNNNIYSVDRNVCLPNLEHLDLGHNTLHLLKTGGFLSLRKLRLLSLSDLRLKEIQPLAFASDSLETVYMSSSDIDFSSDSISAQMFHHCPKLSFIILNNNNFSNVTDAKFQELFHRMPMLTTVYLGYLKIKTITSATFKGLSHVKELNLYSNAIEDLPDGVFDLLVNLTILRLDHNRLSEIRETTFSVSTRQRLHLLDLSNNPYLCTCNVQWFRSWLMDERQKFVKFPTGYVCAPFSSSSKQVGKTTIMADVREAGKYNNKLSDFPQRKPQPISRHFQNVFHQQHQQPVDSAHNETSVSKSRGHVFLPPVHSTVYLSDFFLSDQACLLSQSTSLLTAVLAAVLVVFMLTFLVLYKYRWHIRLALYEAFRGNPQRRQQQPEREYEYDVFVSYANEDVDWVRQELIPTLEGR